MGPADIGIQNSSTSTSEHVFMTDTACRIYPFDSSILFHHPCALSITTTLTLTTV
jgi:hypothetical protein